MLISSSHSQQYGAYVVYIAVNRCPALTARANGDIVCSLGSVYDGIPTNGNTCTFTCDDGYGRHGPQKRQCKQMKWNGRDVNCVGGIPYSE